MTGSDGASVSRMPHIQTESAIMPNLRRPSSDTRRPVKGAVTMLIR